MTGPQDEPSKSEIVPAPVRPINPLLLFFQAVLAELKKQLTEEDFSDLLENCGAEREGQDIEANATPA